MSGEALAKVVFPAAVLCMELDPVQLHVYAGGQDGRIYQCNLYKSDDGGNFRARLAQGDAVSADAANTFVGHQSAVRGLALTFDGRSLVSCSDDGTARVWDAPSRQLLRTHNPKTGPLVAVRVLIRPPALLDPLDPAHPPPPVPPAWKRTEVLATSVATGDAKDIAFLANDTERFPAFTQEDHPFAWPDTLAPTAPFSFLPTLRLPCDRQDDDAGWTSLDTAAYDRGPEVARRLARLLREVGTQHHEELQRLRRALAGAQAHTTSLRALNDQLYRSVARAVVASGGRVAGDGCGRDEGEA
ncbi:hypothetical protein HK405_013581, partial [Cladochytrium tenue]